jgi:hypothetical protein
MSEATIFEFPYNLFVKQRLEFVVICQDHLAAAIMRIVEYEMIKSKETWQNKVVTAVEAKKTPPKEPAEYWVRLSHGQLIAKLYYYDSGKIEKPGEDATEEEIKEYLKKKGIALSKSTIRRTINLLIEMGFLLMRSKPGDEFGAPLYTLHRANIQKAMKALPQNPFSIFNYWGGVSNLESGGELANLELPPNNLESGELPNCEVGVAKNESPHFPNCEVFKDNRDITSKISEDNLKEGTCATSSDDCATSSPASEEIDLHQEMGTPFPSSSVESTQEKSSEVHRLTNPSTTLPEKIVDADESARRIEAETQDCASGLQVISAQKDALSTAKKQPEPNIRIAPKVQQKTPEKVEILPKPERPQMPPASMKWGVEKMVQITEAKRYVDKKQGAYFSEKVAEKSGKSQRDRQLEAAKKILALQIVNPRTDELENITEEHYLRAYNIRNDEWWNGEQGSLTVEDMYAKTSKKKIRILEVLERNDSKSAGVGGNAKRGTLSKQREDVHRQAAVTVATSVPPIDTEKLEAEKQAKIQQVRAIKEKLKRDQEERDRRFLEGAM